MWNDVEVASVVPWRFYHQQFAEVDGEQSFNQHELDEDKHSNRPAGTDPGHGSGVEPYVDTFLMPNGGEKSKLEKTFADTWKRPGKNQSRYCMGKVLKVHHTSSSWV